MEENDAKWPYICLNKKCFTFKPYGLRLITYGAIVVIVPNEVPLTSAFYCAISSFFENPKSMILYVPLCDMMFSAFRSLWMMLWRWSSCIGEKIPSFQLWRVWRSSLLRLQGFCVFSLFRLAKFFHCSIRWPWSWGPHCDTRQNTW